MTPTVLPSRAAGIAAALFAALVWAGWIPITRLGVTGQLRPVDVTVLRYGTAAVLMLPVLWWQRRHLPWSKPGWLLVVAAGAGAPYFLLFSAGMRLANSGQAAVFGPGASSVCTIILAKLWLGERIGPARLAGIACTVGGFVWVMGHDLLGGGTRLTGFALILAAAAAWSVFTIASRHLRLAPVLTVAFVAVTNAICLIPWYLGTSGIDRLRQAGATSVLLQAGYQGIMTGTIAMISFAYAVRELGASGAAVFTPLTPVLATVIGWWLLGDTVDIGTAGGLLAVAFGVLIGNRQAIRVA